VRCPNCREPLDRARLSCANGHTFAYENGVLILLSDDVRERLQTFASRLSSIREAEGKRRLDTSQYEHLPFIDGGLNRHEWRLRRIDLEVVLGLLGRRSGQRVLDIGAWNGWLSHQLAERGHDVTSVDYFADEFDGLGARKFYCRSWRTIQMDLVDLSPLEGPYDLVVVNRCLAFFPRPLEWVETVQGLIAPGGLLILTGLQLFRDPAARARALQANRRFYRDRYAFELFFRPTKGYLDWEDRRALRARGISLRSYPRLWTANLKALILRRAPWHTYGLWSARQEGLA
jgi:2-polyprenyl-3-methyl-5-hydroxy-6-metoxy-1,4-benzoquinol methylase